MYISFGQNTQNLDRATGNTHTHTGRHTLTHTHTLGQNTKACQSRKRQISPTKLIARKKWAAIRKNSTNFRKDSLDFPHTFRSRVSVDVECLGRRRERRRRRSFCEAEEEEFL